MSVKGYMTRGPMEQWSILNSPTEMLVCMMSGHDVVTVIPRNLWSAYLFDS
jgi:hypothetical protein